MTADLGKGAGEIKGKEAMALFSIATSCLFSEKLPVLSGGSELSAQVRGNFPVYHNADAVAESNILLRRDKLSTGIKKP